jgi:hypothetical protein
MSTSNPESQKARLYRTVHQRFFTVAAKVPDPNPHKSENYLPALSVPLEPLNVYYTLSGIKNKI